MLTSVRMCDLGTKEAIDVLSVQGVLWCKFGDGKLIPCDESVFEAIKRSPYGASVDFVYDGLPRDDDENLLYAEICMPCEGDMF